MNIKEIERLMERYFEGDTTLEEERTLKEFFRSGNVPPHLLQHRALFGYYDRSRTEEMPENGQAAALEKALDETVIVPMHEPRRFYLAAVAAAAVLLLCIGLAVVFHNSGPRRYSQQDRLAYAQAREALAMVSSGLNTGLEKITYLDAFSKGMEKAQMISEFNTYQNIIMNPDGSRDRSTTHR